MYIPPFARKVGFLFFKNLYILNLMKKILLIEDDPQLLELYSEPFLDADFDVITESGGKDGLAKAKGFQPDIILLDIVMRDMTGIEVLKRLKSESYTATIPVIMLTSITDESVIAEAKRLGAHDYWVKGKITPKEILNNVQTMLGMTT
jgi:DNA-binding response OmpR family regulator